MPETTQVIAGRCTTTYDDGDVSRRHGDVVVVCKPDGTVLVHDAEGYQPVAWLTRASRVALDADGLRAWRDDTILQVDVEQRYGRGRYPTGTAGTPIGSCPDCDASLLRAAGRIACVGCEADYGLPSGSERLEEACESCDLPRIAVDRGRRFEVCIDPTCEPLDEAVTAAFDREWSCPDCGADLRVRRRGGLLLGCEDYPDCDWSRSVPRATFDGTCDCGLPGLPDGCLDPDCDAPTAKT